MIDRLLVHTATIDRPTHVIAGQKKAFGATVGATTVACRVEPAGESPRATLLGLTSSEAWRAWFPPGTDVRIRAEVVITYDGVAMRAIVESVEPYSARDGAVSHHLEAMLRRRQATS